MAISGFHLPKTSDSKIFKTKDLYHFCILQELFVAFHLLYFCKIMLAENAEKEKPYLKFINGITESHTFPIST